MRRLPVPTVFLANLSLHRLIDGGDWDRRNRLKVYTGLSFLSIRQFKRGGELLLDALSMFTATESLGYNEFIGLAIITNTLPVGLKMVDLKKKVTVLFWYIFFILEKYGWLCLRRYLQRNRGFRWDRSGRRSHPCQWNAGLSNMIYALCVKHNSQIHYRHL